MELSVEGLDLRQAGLLAGSVATFVFIASYLPMLVKAARTREMSSYSGSSLLIANLGNLVQTLYVVSLPLGPLWALHTFYLISSAFMLLWWWQSRRRARQAIETSTLPELRDEVRQDDRITVRT